MTNAPKIRNATSPVKRELDRLELIERVPELQRQAAQLAGNGFELVLHLPRHPAVTAYADECAAIVRDKCDLKTARRNLKAARVNYENRVRFRIQRNINEWLDGGLFVSLSAILEARAEAKHWRKVVKELEYVARIKEQNRQSIVRHRLHSMGLAC
jgi:hypothetical protein